MRLNLKSFVFSRVGCTRFDRSTRKNPLSGSTASEVPVKPVCPNAVYGRRSPMKFSGVPARWNPRPRRTSPSSAWQAIALRSVAGER